MSKQISIEELTEISNRIIVDVVDGASNPDPICTIIDLRGQSFEVLDCSSACNHYPATLVRRKLLEALEKEFEIEIRITGLNSYAGKMLLTDNGVGISGIRFCIARQQ